jgi:multidrug resistance efflux pump
MHVAPTQPPTANGRHPGTPELPKPPTGGTSRARCILWTIGVIGLLAALVAGTIFGYRYLDSTINYVSTDNARVATANVPVGSMNAGKVSSLNVDIGSRVHEGEVLAQIEIPTPVRTLSNGTPDLEFQGASDQHTPVLSPLDGIVVAVPAAVGQTVSQGQPIVTLIDPTQVWISANIDENEIAKVHVGQPTQVYVAAADRTYSGKVTAITPATAASFLAQPATNATGDYTNPGQLVPIKIMLNDTEETLYAGATAQVKIRVTRNE